MKSISLTSRHDFVSLFGCPHLGEADFVDLEVLIYFLQCASFGGVDLFDPEARIFLQCASFSGVDHFDPEAPVYFCSALPSVGSITLTLRHQFIFAVRFLQWGRSL